MPRIVAERGSLGGVGIITKYAKTFLFVSNSRIHTCIFREYFVEKKLYMFLQIFTITMYKVQVQSITMNITIVSDRA